MKRLSQTLPVRSEQGRAVWWRHALGGFLVMSALLSNAWGPEVMPAVQYWPGSVFVLLAVVLYGVLWGGLAALASTLPLLIAEKFGLATVFLLEPLILAAALRRSGGCLFLLDAEFWVVLGGPLLWVITTFTVESTVPLAVLQTLYQVLVGVTNALVASLFLSVTPLPHWANRQMEALGIKDTFFVFAGGLILVLTLVLLTMMGRHTFDTVNARARQVLSESADSIEQQVALRLGGTVLSDAPMKRILTEILVSEATRSPLELAFVNQAGQPLVSTYAWHRRDQLHALVTTVPHTEPTVTERLWLHPPDPKSFWGWWNAHYRAGRPLTVNDTQGLLVLSHTLRPLLADTYRYYLQALAVGFTVLLLGLAIARFLSQRLSDPLRQLGLFAAQLPQRLYESDEPLWGKSRIREINFLTDSLRNLNQRLRYEFRESVQANRLLRQANNRLQAEVEERRAAEAALAESEGRFRQLAENMPHAVLWMSSADGRRLLYVSPTYEHLSGYPLDDLYKHWPGSWLAILHPEDRPALQQAVEENSLFSKSLDVEYRIVRSDGEIRWFRVVGFPIRNEVGDVYRYGGITTDITPQKVAEAELRAHQNELAHMARLNLANELSSGLAHEVGQPLTAVVVSAYALKERCRLGPIDSATIQPALDRIVEQATRARDIIRRLRALVRKTAPNPLPVHLNAVVQEALDLLQLELRDQQVRVHLDLAEDLPPVLVDEVQIQQVLLNLIRNAGDAMQTIPPERRDVLIQAVAEGDWVRATVTDRGPGISDQFADHLFEPFHTTKEQGMGVGLWISRSIVERYQGTLNAENRPEGGAVFSVCLPRSDRPADSGPCE